MGCGVKTVMKRFSFFSGCCLGRRILQQTDNLSKSLQQSTLSAAEGQQITKIVVDLFWEDTLKSMERFDVEPPELPRKRKAPARLDPVEPFFHDSCVDMYRNIYFQAYDFTTNAIERRFNQPDFQMYIVMKDILLESVEH